MHKFREASMQWKYGYIYELYFSFMPGHFHNRGHEWPSMTQPKSSSMSASIWKCGWSANYRCMELYLHNSVDWGWRKTFPLFVSFPLHRSDADGWSGRLIHSFPGMAWMSQLPRTVCPRHTWNVARVDIRAGSKNKMSPVWRRRRRCDNVSPTWKAEGQQDKKKLLCEKRTNSDLYSAFTHSTGISSLIRTKLREWAVWQARAGFYSRAAMSSNDSKTL